MHNARALKSVDSQTTILNDSGQYLRAREAEAMCDHVWIFEARTLSTQPVRRRCAICSRSSLVIGRPPPSFPGACTFASSRLATVHQGILPSTPDHRTGCRCGNATRPNARLGHHHSVEWAL
jgi:hypothetical protein